ncbi:hypothetical protein QWI17_15975 [Gilvimarinus sp. SDUM040013]|uniref:Methyltransferase type 11 domain-containing protein n=1 Tax=Gilvimarinus gilvus TaxID=3058038 RepID=A0ABU4RVX9_9GAMM|nr:methyltransferase domain-containing protein [Gilvimarinus sp. SDUM040013]MDO3387339.1 hypothetical protein [Gilvimarinus sp. SDUM040013]MDX6849028.1 hypothetical protein [Gilvimarinus sp. SDUM040013]
MLVDNLNIPKSFDVEFYRSDKPFLQSADEATDHFLSKGKRQGFKGSPACDQGYLLRFVHRLKPDLMLEIGPGSAPKLKGPNVRYFDVKSKKELEDRYINDVSSSQIPDIIHYVDKEGSLGGINDKFDVVFSSHAIEHTFDFIAHLNEVEEVLKGNGLYVLVVPNKNFTFDYFKPVSILEDILAAHFDCNQKPSLPLKSMLLEINRRTHNNPKEHWAGSHGDLGFDKKSILDGIERFRRTASDSVAASGYHNWIFTENSFEEIVTRLHDLNLISLRVLGIYNTPFNGMSFSAILGK